MWSGGAVGLPGSMGLHVTAEGCHLGAILSSATTNGVAEEHFARKAEEVVCTSTAARNRVLGLVIVTLLVSEQFSSS